MPGCGRHRNQGRASGTQAARCSSHCVIFPQGPTRAPPTLLDHFASVLQEISPGQAISGIRLAFPGPSITRQAFASCKGWENSTPFMGSTSRHALACRMDIEPEAIRFANDASAFALGELGFGLAKAAPRAMFICIGTGCGSAFGVGGALAPLGTPAFRPVDVFTALPFWRGVWMIISPAGGSKS